MELLSPTSYMPSWYGDLIQQIFPLTLQRIDPTISKTVIHILATSDGTAASESFCYESVLKWYTESQRAKREGRQCVYMLV
jgi:hypothetical protein